MTVATQSSKVVGRGNGAATSFPYAFEIPDANSLLVSFVDDDGAVTTLSPAAFSVSGLGDPNGGSVSYPLSGSPMATGQAIVIARDVPLTQPTRLVNQGGYYPEVVEGALDRLEMQIQQLAAGAQNYPLALTFPAVDVDPITVLPPAVARAGQFLGFDANGNPALLPSNGIPGDLSVYSTIATGSITARTFSSRFADMVCVKDFGALGNGVTNDTAAIQAAIDFAAAALGAGVWFPPGTYIANSQLTLKSEVMLYGEHAILSWGGGAAGKMFSSSTTAPLERAGLKGFKILAGAAPTVLELNSAWRFTCTDIEFVTSSNTSFVIDLRCNSSGATNQDANYNNAFGYYANLLQTGDCGTFLRMIGNAVVPGQVVTLNSFFGINAMGCKVRGIDIAKWADSNTFAGMIRLAITGSNGVGVEVNTDNPTAERGVYAIIFEHLAVDTFPIGGVVNRTGLKLNLCKGIKVGYYYNDPIAEAGDLVVNAFCSSYEIKKVIVSQNFEQSLWLGQFLCIGGTPTEKYSIYTTSFSLRGVDEASIVAADTFSSTAAGSTCAGVTVTNHTEATGWVLTSYYGFNVVNLALGAGSSLTNQAGLFVADLTSATNNFGILTRVMAGASKWNFYAEGTANNYFDAGYVLRAGATNATSGFARISAAAGAPVGIPEAFAGNAALYYNTSTNELYAYNGAWRKVALT